MVSSSGLQIGGVAAETTSVQPNGSPLVLVLDDEDNVRRSMRTYLERHSYEALEASTVEGALQIMRSRTVAAVIFDVRLAGSASGLEALNALRRLPEMATVPVLIITGGILSEDEEREITRQRAHLIYKPEGFDTIVNFLDQLTGRDYSH
jgi:response regulator RpfG family c-di-GMP phosphodiesterase